MISCEYLNLAERNLSKVSKVWKRLERLHAYRCSSSPPGSSIQGSEDIRRDEKGYERTISGEGTRRRGDMQIRTRCILLLNEPRQLLGGRC